MQGGSRSETDNISRYRLEVDGTSLRMCVTDQPIGCVQRFDVSGHRATHTGDDGECDFTVPGENGPGVRTTQSDVLVLSDDGSRFDETVTYQVVYPNSHVCHGDDGGTWVRE